MMLIFRHEFLHTITRKAFIIMTLIVPIFALIAIGIGHLISASDEPPVTGLITIGYVDEAGGFDRYTHEGIISLTRFNTREDATTALIQSGVAQYFVITPDYM